MGLKREGKSKPTETATKETTGAVPTDDSTQYEIATSPKEAQAMAQASTQGFTQFLQVGEEQGNSGMELDRTSFPVVVLDSGNFCDNVTKDDFELEGEKLNKEFLFEPMAWKKRVVYTVTPAGSTKDDDGDFYVLMDDGVTFHTGELKSEVLSVAEADGADIKHKEYVDYIVIMYAPKDTNAENPLGLVSLSIPPASKGRVAGAVMTYQAKNRCIVKSPTDCLFKAYVGGKIVKDRNTYYPWAFTVLRYDPK